ncbi:MAG: hypothetical protein Q8L48_17200 [Archangium sp.]|nr:hypothetical protein [Archangium sp.]
MENITGVETELGREGVCAGAKGQQCLRLRAVLRGELREFLFEGLHDKSEASTGDARRSASRNCGSGGSGRFGPRSRLAPACPSARGEVDAHHVDAVEVEDLELKLRLRQARLANAPTHRRLERRFGGDALPQGQQPDEAAEAWAVRLVQDELLREPARQAAEPMLSSVEDPARILT